MIKRFLSIQQKKKIFVRMLLCNVLMILLVMGTSCAKETPAKVTSADAVGHKDSKEYEVSVKIKEWRSEGFVGAAVTGNDMIKKGENVTVTFSDEINVSNPDGSKFEYDIENPNADECGIKNGATIKVTYTAYELASENDTDTTIYADKITG